MSSMTKKHFRAIAHIINDSRAPFDDYPFAREVCDTIAHRLADLCAEENPLFDRSKFLEACGVDEEPECMACIDEQVCDCCAERES